MLAPSAQDLPLEGSAEYERECDRVHRELAAKFAWTVQHQGMIYRQEPAAVPPMNDKTFNRVSRATHSFWYRPLKGGKRLYYLHPSEEEPAPFLDLIRYLFEEDQQAIDHVLDYIAHLVQRPHERVNHALLLTSEAKGIGKSTLGTIIRRLIGERNSGVAQSKDLKSQFDGWLMGKLVVQVDEIYEHGNTDLAQRLKPILTEPTVSVNIKYGPQMVVKNFARLILFSNHAAPIDIEDGDRRYFVFDSKVHPREPEYYERLNAFIGSDDGMAASYWWLKRRCLASFKPYAAPPLTLHKEAVIEASVSPLRQYVQDAVQSGHLLQLGREFTMDALQRQLTADGYGAQAKSVKELGMALKDAGVLQGRSLVNGKRTRVYRLPDWVAENADPPEF